MSNRVTRANLEGVADVLTDVMRRAGVIEPAARVTLEGAYGGWRYSVTGGALGTGVRVGVAGLNHGYEPARATWHNGAAVANAIRAVLYAVKYDGAVIPVEIEGVDA